MTIPPTPSDRPAAGTAPSDVLAAIDIGSNSFRLELARLDGTRYRKVDYLKDMVRLGAGLDEQSRLGGAAVDRGLACLRRFRERLAGLPPERIRAVATQTLREASNRNDFLRLASEALGHPIEVISGREEARLIYKGVAALQRGRERRLVIDIGGRSTELILGQGDRVLEAESHPVGSVGLSARYFGSGQFTAAAFEAARTAAAAEFEENTALFERSRWQQALGSSGTAGAVGRWLEAHGRGHEGFDLADLDWCREQCLQRGSVDGLLARLPDGLEAQRVPVIAGGLAILTALFELLDLDRVRPVKGALRQGVVLDLAEKLAARDSADHRDLRDDTIAQLQRRYGVDLAQAGRVQACAEALLLQLQPEVDLDERRELAWVAGLHEMGMMVSHHDHHRHSAYLIGHVEAPGFSQDQLRLLAQLALGQRGGLRKVEELCAQPMRRAQLLALRLAVLLCHAREPAPAGLQAHLAAQGKGRPDRLSLRWPQAWEVDRPRTVYLLAQEAAAWARLGDVDVVHGGQAAH